MKFITWIIFCLLFSLTAYTQEQNKNIYSGGMLILQPGYVYAENGHQQIRDHNFGLGGMLRFYLFRNLTVGVFGGTQKTSYDSSNSKNSSISIGYGGPMVGFTKKSGKFRYTAAFFAGPGTIRNLHIESQKDNFLDEAYFYKKSTLVYSPLLSLDYALTQRLVITMQGAFLMSTFSEKPFYNPVLQVGVLFNR
jgi:hypothetical protein